MKKREPIIVAGLLLTVTLILTLSPTLNRDQDVDTTPLFTTPAETVTQAPLKHFEDVYVSLMIEQLKCHPLKAPVYFRFTPFPNETIYRVSVAGDFAGWAPHDMFMLDNGTWTALFCVFPGTVVYKYLINGAWVRDMSTNHYGLPVDPDAQGYVDDGFGGKNALRQVSSPSETRFFIHIEDDPMFLSLADEMLVARLFTSNMRNASVYLIVNGEYYGMKKQLWTDYTIV